jgi:hypothetical protein
MNKNFSMRHLLHFFTVFFVALFFGNVFWSCNKFEGDQTIPAYIHIDTIVLSTDYFTHGAATSNITDAWIYIDNNIVGAYELPATFPVLEKGKHKITVRPGIKLNGISSTRVWYPFYSNFEIADFELIEDSVRTIHPTTTYTSTTFITWMEDFEGADISLTRGSSSDTMISKTPANDPNAWQSPYSAHSGVVHLDEEHQSFDLYSFDKFADLPGLGAYVMLEIDYKCTQPFMVGMLAVATGSSATDYPLINVAPTDKWKKIYINLSPTVSENINNVDYFQVYFSGALGNDPTATFYFDNIKLIYNKD